MNTNAIRLVFPIFAGIVFSVLNILNFHDYTLWKTAILIIGWGVAAWIGVRIKLIILIAKIPFRVVNPLEPSWNPSLWLGIIYITTMSLMCFGKEHILTILDFITVVILITYIGAKIGCIWKKCCYATTSTFPFNKLPEEFLPKIEVFITIFTLIICVFSLILFNKAGITFIIFLLLHGLDRLISYFYRNDYKNINSIIKISLPILIGLALLFYSTKI